MDKRVVTAGVVTGLATITAFAYYYFVHRKRGMESVASDKNYAFVFIKPHANTARVQNLVKAQLLTRGIKITNEGEFTADQIDKGMLIDQHYYAIASKATLLKPADIPVPVEKFKDFFGLTWEEALNQGSVYNAIDACTFLGVDAAGLDDLWAKCRKVKFGGGFYCGLVEKEGKQGIYVFNAFFMSMRDQFVTPGTSIHYFVVEFEPSVLSWADFRGRVLGPTDPKAAPQDSLRGMILKDWASLGLTAEPTTGNNCVHASASPFEGLAERMNWLKVSPEQDPFGAKALLAGIPVQAIKDWSVDPQVKGKSIFDQLEDTDAKECVEKMTDLL